MLSEQRSASTRPRDAGLGSWRVRRCGWPGQGWFSHGVGGSSRMDIRRCAPMQTVARGQRQSAYSRGLGTRCLHLDRGPGSEYALAAARVCVCRVMCVPAIYSKRACGRVVCAKYVVSYHASACVCVVCASLSNGNGRARGRGVRRSRLRVNSEISSPPRRPGPGPRPHPPHADARLHSAGFKPRRFLH